LSAAKPAAVFAAPAAGSKSMPFALMAPETWLAAPEAAPVALPTSSLATGPAVRSTYLTPASATGRAASTARLTTGDATSAAFPATSAALPNGVGGDVDGVLNLVRRLVDGVEDGEELL
jgi:hypothetical protein